MNAAVLKGGEFLHASDKKEREKKGLPPSKKDKLLYRVQTIKGAETWNYSHH